MQNSKKLLTNGFLVANLFSPSRRFRSQVTAALLVICLMVAMSFSQLLSGVTHADQTGHGQSGPGRNMSADLQEFLNTAAGGWVGVIVETKPSPNGQAFSRFLTRIAQLGGTVSRRLNNDKHLAVQIPVAAAAALASDNAVKYVTLDKTTHVTGHLETTSGAALARGLGTTATGAINGSGVGIAILDSGIYAAHHSFLNSAGASRIVASVDFTGEGRTDDPYGHGTHVASIAAASNHVADGAYTGIAPNAKLINVRVLNARGEGSISNAIAGIDWCIANKAAYNIRVLNLSFGATATDSYADDPLCQAVRRAFDAGLVVCVAAGNAGKNAAGNKVFGSIHSPGIEPSAITVGAANTFATDARTDDGVTSYSSRGPTRGFSTDSSGVRHFDNLIKPDLVAPGNKIIDAESPNNLILSTSPQLDALNTTAQHDEMYMSGTSMATPAVAGAAALILQRNPNLTPNLVKAILEYTAQPLAGFNTFEQGAGELNVEGAVRLAGLIRTDLLSTAIGLVKGSPLLVGPAPTQRTTIAGYNFAWGGGIIQRYNFIYGNNLMLQYQRIYGTSTLLTDGVLLTNGALFSDGALLSDGVLLSQGALLADGTLLSSGTLVTQGALLSDGALLADGVLFADGALFSDSTLAAMTSPSAASAMAQSALSGDQTEAMLPVPDTDPSN
ncbi:MAG TPA: S8 family peptidase [Blastocatellia bacterium]|nr:S8 family peptidase [Blastocatellia bacterium]